MARLVGELVGHGPLGGLGPLGQAPVRHRGHAGAGDEQGVHAGPFHRVVPSGGVVVGRVRGDHAHHAVVDDDVGDRQQEGGPVLVEGDHEQHHEEVEMGLDQPAGQVDEHGRGGEQPERRQRGAHAPAEPPLARQPRQDHQRHHLDQAVPQPVAAHERVAPQGRGVQGEYPQDDPVTQPPRLLGQWGALGEDRAKPSDQVGHHTDVVGGGRRVLRTSRPTAWRRAGGG